MIQAVWTTSAATTIKPDIDNHWSISSTKSGWTPIGFTPITYGWAAQLLINPEGAPSFGNGSFSMGGYGKSTNGGTYSVTIGTYVIWRKN